MDQVNVVDLEPEELTEYYLLGYTSTNAAKDGKFRRVRIRVNRPELRVEHRSGYYALSDFRHAGREDRERQLHDQLLAELSATDFPVWVQSAHFRARENRFYVPVSVAVPGRALPLAKSGAKERVTLDVAAVVRDEAKRAVARLRDGVNVIAADVGRKSVQYRTGFTLPPGKYRFKVVVRENEAGTFGSFETELLVPDLRKDPVKVSSVLFGTQRAPAPRVEPPSPLARDGSELVPSVTHVVSTSQPLYFYYEVYDPAHAAAAKPPRADERRLLRRRRAPLRDAAGRERPAERSRPQRSRVPGVDAAGIAGAGLPRVPGERDRRRGGNLHVPAAGPAGSPLAGGPAGRGRRRLTDWPAVTYWLPTRRFAGPPSGAFPP